MFTLPSYNTILLVAAMLPVVLLLIYMYCQDRLEPEPLGLLLSLVALGALSTFAALFVERWGMACLPLFAKEGTKAYLLVENFVVVGLVEESAKFLLLKLRTWKHPAFNCRFDGLVYAVFVSLGFALWENIGYVATYGFQNALVRGVTAVPAHACFGIFMGIGYSSAKHHLNRGEYLFCAWSLTLSVLIPTLLHGTYDYVASTRVATDEWVFFALVVGLLLLTYLLLRYQSKKDKEL